MGSFVSLVLMGILLLGGSFAPSSAQAAEFWGGVNAAGGFNVPIRSMQELKYLETVRQRFDFSCGSAAVATLLSHHYQRETREAEVFLSMWEEGDKVRIRKDGFSLLDMKGFLDDRGFNADGFRIAADRIGEIGVAGIVLLEHLDQPHFVVVTGEVGGEILVNDPARGIWSMSVDELKDLWNGIFFVIRGKATLARSNFNDIDVWKHRRWSPVSSETLAQLTVPLAIELPEPSEFNAN